MNETISFHCITDPTRQHAYFWALYTADSAGYVAAFERDPELSIQPFEFTDPAIVAETEAWLAAAAAESGRPPAVMVGSVEHGHWANWNLVDLPCPPVPAY